MAARVLAPAHNAPSLVVCRGLPTSREALVYPRSSSRQSLMHPSPVPPSRVPPAMSMRRRTFFDGSLASVLLLTCDHPVHAIDNEYEDWYRFEGQGFALSVPPDFEDVRDPEEDFVDGPLYGNKAKPKAFAARFASADRSEVLSVVVRESAQLKLTFLAVKDVTDLGSLREAAKIFVPVGAKLYAARVVKPPDEISNRTYYYYEFATGDNYIALEAGASGGQVYVLGVTAPKGKWKDDFRKLRLAAASFSVL